VTRPATIWACAALAADSKSMRGSHCSVAGTLTAVPAQGGRAVRTRDDGQHLEYPCARFSIAARWPSVVAGNEESGCPGGRRNANRGMASATYTPAPGRNRAVDASRAIFNNHVDPGGGDGAVALPGDDSSLLGRRAWHPERGANRRTGAWDGTRGGDVPIRDERGGPRRGGCS
jgi:hypothetical protein